MGTANDCDSSFQINLYSMKNMSFHLRVHLALIEYFCSNIIDPSVNLNCQLNWNLRERVK